MFIVSVLDVSRQAFVTTNAAKLAPFIAITRVSELEKQKITDLQEIEEQQQADIRPDKRVYSHVLNGRRISCEL